MPDRWPLNDDDYEFMLAATKRDHYIGWHESFAWTSNTYGHKYTVSARLKLIFFNIHLRPFDKDDADDDDDNNPRQRCHAVQDEYSLQVALYTHKRRRSFPVIATFR